MTFCVLRSHLPPLFRAGRTKVCFERVLLPAIGASTFRDSESRALFRSSVLEFCRIDAPEQVNAQPGGAHSIRVVFLHRRMSRSIRNVLELCQGANKRPGVLAAVMDAAWLATTVCGSAFLMQNTEIFIAVSGSGNGMLSLLPQGAVYIHIHSFRSRNPLNKPLAYFGGVHYLEYVPLNADLIWPAVEQHPCSNISILSWCAPVHVRTHMCTRSCA